MKTIDYKKVIRENSFPVYLYNTAGESDLIRIERDIVKGLKRAKRTFIAYLKAYNNYFSFKV